MSRRTKENILKNGKKRFFKVFYRYLVSYFFVLLLPLVFIVTFNFRFLIKNIEKYIVNENMIRFHQTKDGIENEYSQLMSISCQILNNDSLSNLSGDPDYESITLAKNVLMNYVITNNFVNDIFFFDRRTSKLLTSKSYVDFDFFFTNIYRIGSLQPDQVKSMLLQLESNCFLEFTAVNGLVEATNSSGAYITSSHLVGIQNSNYYLGFILNVKKLADLTAPLGAYRNYFLLSPDNVILNNYDPNWKDMYPHILIILDSTEKKGNLQINAKPYFYFCEKTEYSGLKHVSLTPKDLYAEDINRNKWLFLFILGICVTMSSVLIFLMTIYNYRPIRKLLTYTSTPVGKDGDEFYVVEQTIKRINQNNKTLANRLERNKLAAAEKTVSLLLKNEITDRRDIEDFFHELNIPYENTTYRVIIVRPEITIATLQFQAVELIECFKNNMPSELKLFGIESIVNSYFIFVLFYPRGTTEYSPTLESFVAHVRNSWNLIVTIGIGSIYTNHTDIAKSYLEAISCLEYSIIKGCGSIISSDEISNENNVRNYPYQIIENIYRSLSSGDYDGFFELLDELRETIYINNYPLYMVRMIGYEVISKIQNMIYSENIDLKQKKNMFSHIESLLNLRSIDLLFQDIKAIVTEFIKVKKLEHTDNSSRKIYQMVDFIQINYSDPRLSASLLAEKFAMSRANFSRYFKQHFGITFVDYISKLRIEKAMELLTTTDLPLKEIVIQIGYSDSSTFIKKFREYTKVTPLNFRRNG